MTLRTTIRTHGVQRCCIHDLPVISIACKILTFAGPADGQSFHAPERIDIVPFAEWSPVLSHDGLEIFFTRYVSDNNWDIFTAQRESTEDEWWPPESVGDTVNSSLHENTGTFSADGLTMVFGSQRPGGFGFWDLWQTSREEVGGEWTEPVNLESINSSGGETTPSLSSDGLTLFFGTGCCPGFAHREGDPAGDIWYSTRQGESSPWSPPLQLDAVNSSAFDSYPSISRDGLSLYFASDRQGTYGHEDIYVSTRSSVDDEFGEPLNLGPVINSPNVDLSPFIGSDGALYYTRDAVRPAGPFNLWRADPRSVVPGDFDLDGVIDASDVDILSEAIHRNRKIVGSDLNEDRIFDLADVRAWVKEIRGTWLGDANLDGEFNSSDMVQVFAAGKYETGQDSGWAEGDWDANLKFNGSDMVAAFADGGYEMGPKLAARAVPEPSAILSLVFSVPVLGLAQRAWRLPRHHPGPRR